MWRSNPVILGVLSGICGVGIALLTYHAYQDHLVLHDMQVFLQAVAPKIAKLP